jgi:hypothetical protein
VKLPGLAELMAVFEATWKEEAGETPVEYTKEESRANQTDTARRMLEAFIGSPYAYVEGQTLGIEETLRVTLAPDLPDLLAKLDHLSATERELVVSDFKTARAMWGRSVAEDRAEQLHLYAEAVKPIAEDLRLPIKLRFVILTKAKTPKVEAVEIRADPDRVRRSRVIIRRVFKAMQSGVVYPSPSAMNCSGCAFRNRCDRWHQEGVPLAT